MGEKAKCTPVNYNLEVKKRLQLAVANGDMLIVCHLMLAHKNRNAILKMERNKSVQGMDVSTPLPANKCSPWTENTSKSKPKKSQTNID